MAGHIVDCWSRRYAATAYVPRRPPRTPRAANTPKVCRVKGTVRGTVIQAHTAIRAAQSLQQRAKQRLEVIKRKYYRKRGRRR